jgi:hypothetical protein
MRRGTKEINGDEALGGLQTDAQEDCQEGHGGWIMVTGSQDWIM